MRVGVPRPGSSYTLNQSCFTSPKPRRLKAVLEYCREANAGKNTWQSGTLGEVGTLAVVLVMIVASTTILIAILTVFDNYCWQ